jgi:short-subunit dehydrogenase/uncharacterized membrane protein
MTTDPLRTDDVLAKLEELDGIIGIVVDRGASVRPPGDCLRLSMTNRGARGLAVAFADPVAWGISSFSSNEPLTLVAPAAADALDNESTEPSWTDVAGLLREESNPELNILALMFLAGGIAAVGLATDAIHLVIGAMIVTPGFEPFLRIPFSLIAGRLRTLKQAFVGLAAGFFLMALGGGLTFHILDSLQTVGPLSGRPLVQYWSTNTAAGVTVAVAGGLAGAFTVTAGRPVFTAGVMIAVALVPSMTVTGVAVAAGDLSLAGQGLLRWAVEAAVVMATAALVIGAKHYTAAFRGQEYVLNGARGRMIGEDRMENRSGVAVVTGASAGIGRATARAFADAGFDVALLARGRSGLEAARRDVEQRGRRALAITADVAQWNDVSAAAEHAERELGPIDVWINDAMTTVFAWSWDVDPDEFRRATEVTYLGQVHGTLAALARMRPRNAGTIVNVGSALAFIGIPLQSAYCGAKFACRGFFQSVRAELVAEDSHVRISMVDLPGVNTPQFDWCFDKLPCQPKPVAPVYQPEVAARAILQMALHSRRSKVLGAWNKLVVAGARAFPEFVTQFAARSTVQGQQTQEPTPPDRPRNLWHPVDEDRDYGARGSFGHQAGGTLAPAFLGQLPKTLRQAAAAATATVRGKLRALAS